MTIYYPDISSFQAGLDLAGTVACCCKVTEGTSYANPDYPRAKANAASHGVLFFAYHFLHAGSAAAQAAWCYSQAGGTPLMLDTESEPPSYPQLADVTAFIDAYRALGGVCQLVYLPKWYWASWGSPSLAPLTARGLSLVASVYSAYTDAGTGAGWQPYGGMTPAVWQYTDALAFNGQLVDFNAYRGDWAGQQDAASVAATIAAFAALISGPPAGPDATTEDTVQVTAQYSDGRIILASTGTDNLVRISEQPAAGAGFSGNGPPIGGALPVTGPLSLTIEMVADVPSVFAQSADPATSGNGDVFTSWKQSDGATPPVFSWAAWRQVT